MKKYAAINVLGGSLASAAKALGVSKQSIHQWEVDRFGNLVSRRVIDSVLAYLVRLNYEAYIGKPDAKRPDIDDGLLHDLLHAPVPEPETESID